MARFALIVFVFSLAVVSAVGCSQESKSTGSATGSATPVAQTSSDGHDHGGWWCSEHGMPEEVCAQCDSKVAAALKAKGDWCAEHNVPLSQCFVHTPDAQAKFAALYEAKYGKAPPPLE